MCVYRLVETTKADKRTNLVRYVPCGTKSSLFVWIGGKVTELLWEFDLPRVGDVGFSRGDVITRFGGSRLWNSKCRTLQKQWLYILYHQTYVSL